MLSFANNKEFYKYLLFLEEELKKRELEDLSNIVAFARKQASGMSTEFLGESRIALQRILKEENGMLTKQERTDIVEALKQLDKALHRK